MLNKMTTLFDLFKTVIREMLSKKHYSPTYRIVSVYQTEKGNYEVTVQIINESNAFIMSPETILSDDKFVDLFSPRDVRTLTYLGYLDIHSPKYKIFAKRLSEDQDKTLFAIKKMGDKEVLVKTASEINNEKEILNHLDSSDAHIVGYIAASESIAQEKSEIQKLKTEQSNQK